MNASSLETIMNTLLSVTAATLLVVTAVAGFNSAVAQAERVALDVR